MSTQLAEFQINIKRMLGILRAQLKQQGLLQGSDKDRTAAMTIETATGEDSDAAVERGKGNLETFELLPGFVHLDIPPDYRLSQLHEVTRHYLDSLTSIDSGVVLK
jgi:hypothetical protein